MQATQKERRREGEERKREGETDRVEGGQDSAKTTTAQSFTPNGVRPSCRVFIIT